MGSGPCDRPLAHAGARRRDSTAGPASDPAPAGWPVHQPRQGLGDGVVDLGPGTDVPVERGCLDDAPDIRNVDHRRGALSRNLSRLLAPLLSSGAPSQGRVALTGIVEQDAAPILVMRDVCKWYAEF